MVEVRRALEAEVASLAAQRRTEADVQAIREAITTLDQAVQAGGDGVREDVAFHRAIAKRPRTFLLSTLQCLNRFLHGATRVTSQRGAARRLRAPVRASTRPSSPPSRTRTRPPPAPPPSTT